MTKKSHIEVFTIGHSTRTLDDFVSLLKHYDIREVVDVRTIPKSAHNPQFNIDTFPTALKKSDIDYLHMSDLGGLRHARPDSLNTGWRNASFRGFADYMQTPQFAHGLQQLIDEAKKKQVVIMCAEAVPWRCHRSLIGDALLAHDVKSFDIISAHEVKEHSLTPWAKIKGKLVIYPAEKE